MRQQAVQERRALAATVPAPQSAAAPLSPNTQRKLAAAEARRQQILESKAARASELGQDRVAAVQERLK